MRSVVVPRLAGKRLRAPSEAVGSEGGRQVQMLGLDAQVAGCGEAALLTGLSFVRRA